MEQIAIEEAIRTRHSVRQYTDKPIEADKLAAIRTLIDQCNRDSGLHIQLATNEPQAFSQGLAKYGKFSGISNYLCMVGPKGADEQVGYQGERLVLAMQQMGLNSCWVALTFKNTKQAYTLAEGEKLYLVIPFGYGMPTAGDHKRKSIGEVARTSDGREMPQWFRRGVEFALLAPTAINQQKFRFTLLHGGVVRAEAGHTLLNSLTRIDLGIAKLHFELGAGTDNFSWE